jgi:hypothetical protein
MSEGLVMKGMALGQVVDSNSGQPSIGAQEEDLLSASATKTARFEFVLGKHPAWDVALAEEYGKVITMLRNGGVETIIGLLGNQIVPGSFQHDHPWNTGFDHADTNAFIEGYLTAVQEVVTAFPSITLWEVWNEPNAWGHHPSAWQNDPVRIGNTRDDVHTFIFPNLYATLLREAASIIREVQPGNKVISGGLFAHGAPTGVTSDPYSDPSGISYLREVYGHSGGHLPCDGVGLHIYLGLSGMLPQATQPSTVQVLLNALRATMHGDLHDIYITEAGFNAPPDQEDHQSTFLKELLALPAGNPFLATACWFTMHDGREEPAHPAAPHNWGLIRQDGSTKAAFTAYLSGR